MKSYNYPIWTALIIIALWDTGLYAAQVQPLSAHLSEPPQKRILQFPPDFSMGEIYITDKGSKREIKTFHSRIEIDWVNWDFFSLAQGDVHIPMDKWVMLNLLPKATGRPQAKEALQGLKPDDLYALNNVNNQSMPLIIHLTGLKNLRCSPNMLARSLRHLIHLKSLEQLSLAEGLTDTGMAQIALCSWLKGLSANFRRTTPNGFSELSKLRGLEELELHNVHVDAPCFQALAPLSSLSFLFLRGDLSDRVLDPIARLASLKTIKLHFIRQTPQGEQCTLTDRGMQYLSRSSSIERIGVHWMNRLTGQTLDCLKDMPKLKKLDVNHARLYDADLVHLQAFKQLNHLTLPNRGISDEGIRHLAPLKNLKYLWVGRSSMSPLSDRSLNTFSRLANLEELFVNGNAFTDQGAAQLAILKNLRTLHLDGKDTALTREGIRNLTKLAHLTNVMLPVTGNGFLDLAKLADLTRVTLMGDSYKTLSDISQLNTLTKLEFLRVSGVHQDDSILDISNLTHLKNLTILLYRNRRQDINDEFKDKDLACLRGLTSLERLQLGSNGIGDEGSQYLAGLRNLNSIIINGSPRITDKTLTYLSPLKKLRRIVIHNSVITDQGLSYLHDTDTLETIEITSTGRIRARAIQQLRRELPHCTNVQIH